MPRVNSKSFDVVFNPFHPTATRIAHDWIQYPYDQKLEAGSVITAVEHRVTGGEGAKYVAALETSWDNHIVYVRTRHVDNPPDFWVRYQFDVLYSTPPPQIPIGVAVVEPDATSVMNIWSKTLVDYKAELINDQIKYYGICDAVYRARLTDEAKLRAKTAGASTSHISQGDFALKVVCPDEPYQVALDDLYERYQVDINRFDRLAHDNIVRLEHCFTDRVPSELKLATPKALFVITELCPLSLQDVINYRNGTNNKGDFDAKTSTLFRAEEILMVARDISNALILLNRELVAHRDIKPDNILIRLPADGNITREQVLADICRVGVAIALNHFDTCIDFKVNECTMMKKMFFLGEPRGGAYASMAPEIAFAQRNKPIELDYSKYDVWSLGIVLATIMSDHLQVVDKEKKLNRAVLPLHVLSDWIARMVESLKDRWSCHEIGIAVAAVDMKLITLPTIAPSAASRSSSLPTSQSTSAASSSSISGVSSAPPTLNTHGQSLSTPVVKVDAEIKYPLLRDNSWDTEGSSQHNPYWSFIEEDRIASRKSGSNDRRTIHTVTGYRQGRYVIDFTSVGHFNGIHLGVIVGCEAWNPTTGGDAIRLDCSTGALSDHLQSISVLGSCANGLVECVRFILDFTPTSRSLEIWYDLKRHGAWLLGELHVDAIVFPIMSSIHEGVSVTIAAPLADPGLTFPIAPRAHSVATASTAFPLPNTSAPSTHSRATSGAGASTSKHTETESKNDNSDKNHHALRNTSGNGSTGSTSSEPSLNSETKETMASDRQMLTAAVAKLCITESDLVDKLSALPGHGWSTRISDYILLTRLGKLPESAQRRIKLKYAGRAAVYRSECTPDARIRAVAAGASPLCKGNFALKVLPRDESCFTPKQVIDNAHELRMWERLPRHDNIIRTEHYLVDCVHMPYPPDSDSWRCEGTYHLFMAMELSHLSLQEVVAYRKAYSVIGASLFRPEEVLMVARDISSALILLGKELIAHRDIKPDNILIRLPAGASVEDIKNNLYQPGVSIVLNDFGEAFDFRVNECKEMKMLFPVGLPRGGAAHTIAPEIALPPRNKPVVLDYTKADVWSLGLVLATMMSTRAFLSSNDDYVVEHTSRQLLSGALDVASSSALSTSVHAIIANMLTSQKDRWSCVGLFHKLQQVSK